MMSHSMVLGLTRIRDIARPAGERPNQLFGMGLVGGLNGTGDSPDSLLRNRAMISLLQKVGNPLELNEMGNVKNVAYVMVTAKIGRNGARSGDEIDVEVISMADAKSLKGGMLLAAVLEGPYPGDDRVYGLARGPITLPDPATPTTGVVKGGGTMEVDLYFNYAEVDEATGEAYFTLVLDDKHANWQNAKAVRMEIETEFAPPGSELVQEQTWTPTAVLLGPKNIQVMIPASQAGNAPEFIARVMALPVILPAPEATVAINSRAGTIVITGNVEIAPVAVTVNGLSIQVIEPPRPAPTPEQPEVRQSQWVPFDTTGEGVVQLQELIDILDRGNFPVEVQINIIFGINEAGALRARLITN